MNDKTIAVKGGVWTGLSTAVSMVAQLARVMILTRFLVKSDFGVVAIVNMVIGLCTTFTDLGFSSVIMYKKELSDQEFSSLYWCQFVIFILIYFVLWAFSPLISSFYSEPLLNTLIPIAALTIIFQAVGKLYDSVLQKRYFFKTLAVRNIISIILSLIIAVLMAIKGYGIYSLVISSLFQVLMLNVWNLLSGCKLQKVKFCLNFRGVLPLIKIGLYQTYTRIADYFSTQLDVMILGKLLGTEALGVYNLAKELVFRFVDFIRTIVSKVGLPILSNNNDNEEQVVSRFLKMTRVVASMCIPLCLVLAVFSPFAVRILYGEDFLDAAPIVSIFSIMAMITSISSFFDMLGIAKGRTDLNFKNTIYRILLTTPVIFVTSLVSVYAVAFGQLIVSIVLSIVFWRIVVMKTYPVPVKEYFSQFLRLFFVVSVVSGITALLMYCLCPVFISSNWIIQLVVYAVVYCFLLVMGSLCFLKSDLQFIKAIINK